jgi:hypothetical protein
MNFSNSTKISKDTDAAIIVKKSKSRRGFVPKISWRGG